MNALNAVRLCILLQKVDRFNYFKTVILDWVLEVWKESFQDPFHFLYGVKYSSHGECSKMDHCFFELN